MMDGELEGRDGVSLDPDLLQLQEVSSMALRDNPQVAEQLFQQWLVLPDTVRLVIFVSHALLCLMKYFILRVGFEFVQL